MSHGEERNGEATQCVCVWEEALFINKQAFRSPGPLFPAVNSLRKIKCNLIGKKIA